MISNVRYPHIVNRYMRGRRPITRLVIGVVLLLLLIVAHRYVVAIGCLSYALYAPSVQVYLWLRRSNPTPPAV